MQSKIATPECMVRKAVPEDFDAILDLQKANTPQNLTKEEYHQQGYIISAMNRDHLAAINQNIGILVACVDNQLVGFVCLNSTDMQPCPPVVAAMLKETTLQKIKQPLLFGERICSYGPVCIDKTFRGRGILRQLFSETKKYLHGQHDTGIAFIAVDNPHSLVAHVQGLGMHDVSVFMCAGKQYHLIAFSI